MSWVCRLPPLRNSRSPGRSGPCLPGWTPGGSRVQPAGRGALVLCLQLSPDEGVGIGLGAFLCVKQAEDHRGVLPGEREDRGPRRGQSVGPPASLPGACASGRGQSGLRRLAPCSLPAANRMRMSLMPHRCPHCPPFCSELHTSRGSVTQGLLFPTHNPVQEGPGSPLFEDQETKVQRG